MRPERDMAVRRAGNKDRDDPFVPCFSRKAHRFARNLAHETRGGVLTGDVVQAAALGLYLGAVFDKAGFALYGSYRQSGARYCDWIAGFGGSGQEDRQWDAVFAAHPLLQSEMDGLERRLQGAWSEFAQRIDRDLNAVRRHFGLPGDSRINKVDLTRSDPHGGHRTVAQIDFTCGSTIFYKPRESRIDREWFTGPGQSGLFDSVLFADTLALEGYGYQAQLSGQPAPVLDQNTAAASGDLLAVAWLLNASDLHADNIVFDGPRIGVLDLETILTPILRYNADHDGQWREANINTTLFFCTDVTQASAHFRSSAFGHLLGADAAPKQPFFAYTPEGEVRPARLLQHPDPAAYRRPPKALVQRMQAHFVRACRDDRRRRGLMDFLDRAAQAELRFVPRDTAEYYKILLELNLPRHLRDPGSRQSYVRQRLNEAHRFDRKQQGSQTERLVADEFAQIMQGDIPIFRFRADSRDLMLSDGSAIEMFSGSAVGLARQKLLCATDHEINEQAELIAGTFGYRFDLPGRRLRPSCRDPLARLAERIMDEAIQPDDAPARWFSVATAVPPHGNTASFGDPSGFKGALGICRALESYLSCEADAGLAPRLDAFLTRQADGFAFFRADKDQNAGAGVIGLEGLAGDLLAACHLIALAPGRWGGLSGYVDALLDALAKAAPDATELDVISGISGALLGLAGAIGLCPAIADRGGALHAALAERFVALCLAGLDHDPGQGVLPLMGDLGFAHGLSGLLAAASRLGDHPQGARISRQVLTAMHDARARHGGWPDLRFGTATAMNLSWCNGSVGVAQALAKAADARGAGALLAQIWTESQSDALFANGTRFCCGASGVLDLAIETETAHPFAIDPALVQGLERRIVSRCIAGFSNDRFDDSFEPQTANLYYGKAGVLYTALRTRHRALPSLSAL
ncbi:DUF4135 domain-containing protein [Tropicibacter oceani]|uniref:DUF4135 domain-containing protein n=1 Tax=Tropicibacter oceani TaxID=3058420 RepID=A0ABY8QGI2_9RHOB|nr:DUF4135 domain-containing protein [Tropicibacter oceani]WGW03624.1 DUF4135 domain-containing protein [Tropicibacter oceani]